MATIQETRKGKRLNTITVTDIESTNIAQLVYNAPDRTITTTFHHGGIYEYQDVSRKEFNMIINADSIGKAHKEVLIDTKKVSLKL